MSRLDSFIRRLEAQRACLGEAARCIAALPGPVLELGLGNGRTYDHLRGLFPGREIYVFERRVNAHPDCIPDPRHLFLGDIRETLPAAAARLGACAALAHADLGSSDPRRNASLLSGIAAGLQRLMRPGALIVSDQRVEFPAWTPLPLPGGVPPGRYFMYRVA